MSVLITDSCIGCGDCVEECPATAIIETASQNSDIYYVKPEKCIECVDSAVPKCADICPTEDCIIWDMPYTKEYETHFVENENYEIRVHKKKGLLSPSVTPKPFRESISIEKREQGVSVGETLKLY